MTYRYRRCLFDMSTEEQDAFVAAMNGLSREYIVGNADEHAREFEQGIHRGPAFLPWHRHFLSKFEKSLQVINPKAMLPFWDWTHNGLRSIDIAILKTLFGGRHNEDGRISGNWSFRRATSPISTLAIFDDFVNELKEETYFDFRRSIEYGSHRRAHEFVGGDMVEPVSPLDPLFYLLHCNIDRVWALWQHNHPYQMQYTVITRRPDNRRAAVPLGGRMRGGATPIDMVMREGLDYLYADTRVQGAADTFAKYRGVDLGGEIVRNGRITTELREQRFPNRDLNLHAHAVPGHLLRDMRTLPFAGSARSHNFHHTNCFIVQRIRKGNRIQFASIEQATEEGYDGCGFCCPDYHSR